MRLEGGSFIQRNHKRPLYLEDQRKNNSEKAAHAMKEANILVNIGNNTSYQLPSKVVEYASTGKAILNLVKTESDSSIPFFDAYPASMCLLEYTESLCLETIEQLIKFIGSY